MEQITSNSDEILNSLEKLESLYNSMLEYQKKLLNTEFCDSKSSVTIVLNEIIEKLQINVNYRVEIMDKVIKEIKSFDTNMIEADKKITCYITGK